MEWMTALAQLQRSGQSAVLVTLTQTRGHSPRAAGAKMVVSAEATWDSIGGGNLEATAIEQAREMLATGVSQPVTEEIALNAHAHTKHGQQCCGGVVGVLYEPIGAPPAVAIFGMGHVGLEIAWMLSRFNISLHLADSRESFAEQSRISALQQGRAEVSMHHSPAPESVLAELPAGAHVLIMTHDHAEDLFLCEAALQREDLGSVGVIGSNAKWQRFRKKLGEAGYSQEKIDSINCPIGIPEITGKAPEAIAISVVASLLQSIKYGQHDSNQETP